LKALRTTLLDGNSPSAGHVTSLFSGFVNGLRELAVLSAAIVIIIVAVLILV
jgi:hypothetical protein